MTNNRKDCACSGIFLILGGFPKTIIESQVLVHVRDMSAVTINMEVWSFACKRTEYQGGQKALSSLQKAFPTIKIRLFRGIRLALPFSEWLNALLLVWWMRRLDMKPAFVHARTEYAAVIAAIAKRIKGYRLIWDHRGDSLSEFSEGASHLSLLRRWRAPLIRNAISRRLKIASRDCDAAIFVSEELRRLDGRGLPDEKTLIVPCLADEGLFYFDPSLREQSRAALGYNENDIVIAYVGSAAIWQCVPETIELMKLALRNNASTKALVVTPDPDVFESGFPKDLRDRARITSCSLYEMNSYLNAADYGVLLRKANSINKVASPVKFAEYSLTGLTVVTTGAVAQVSEIGKNLGNTIEPNDFLMNYMQHNVKPTNRVDISMKARGVLGRKSHIAQLVAFYSLCQ